ncbi:hypothetical protein F4780DRAFT_662960 [Xylariomycetidae sp. FL0641]|nr:hypothetical protein F4780DRAFT_662960 [Xylariomycetidae sp. FL0641]
MKALGMVFSSDERGYCKVSTSCQELVSGGVVTKPDLTSASSRAKSDLFISVTSTPIPRLAPIRTSRTTPHHPFLGRAASGITQAVSLVGFVARIRSCAGILAAVMLIWAQPAHWRLLSTLSSLSISDTSWNGVDVLGVVSYSRPGSKEYSRVLTAAATRRCTEYWFPGPIIVEAHVDPDGNLQVGVAKVPTFTGSEGVPGRCLVSRREWP